MVAARLTVRLDADLAARVERVRKRSGKSVSQLVQESLEAMCERHEEAPGTLLGAMVESGFAASWEGPRDLSSSTRDALADSLKRKT